jgi:1-deoxy-D-xylulose 5-phosphate reductoisomerase
VPAFLAGDIRFGDIPGIIEDILAQHAAVVIPNPDIEAIKWADSWACATASALVAARR